LIFDNYSANPHPADTFPASSFSKKTLVDDDLIEGSSSKHSSQDLQELRQQLQSMKKQTLAMMEQSRKASEREKIALQQAKEAITAKEAAISEAEKATTRENSMLELMTEASVDMLGMLFSTQNFFCLLLYPPFFKFLVLSLDRFCSRHCC
jgi:tRNA U34 5-carboxymethylaminomethyl modifying GTPase MnmE/TrmE